jgi:hypothetical protein
MDNQTAYLVIVPGNLNAVGYMNSHMNNLLPFMQNRGPGCDSAARPHTARVTTQFLAQNGVNVLPWPAVTTDQNPIEHMSDKLGRRVRNTHLINNVNDLRHALLFEWHNIPNDVIRRLTNPIRRRTATGIRANSGHTGY